MHKPCQQGGWSIVDIYPMYFPFWFILLMHILWYKYCSYHNKEIVKCYSAEEQVVSLHSHLWAAPSGSRLIPAAPGSLPHRLPVRNPAGVTSELESPDSKTCSTVLVFGCRSVALYLAPPRPPLALVDARSDLTTVPSWGTIACLSQGL